MPRNGSVGYSDNTPLKQEHFQVILATHMPIVKSILQRKSWAAPHYFYLDLNAGLGRYTLGAGKLIYGSPLIAYAVAKAHDIPLQASLCEHDPASVMTLRKALVDAGLDITPAYPDVLYDPHSPICITLCADDYHITAEALLMHLGLHADGKPYGLIYSDENGSCPPFDLLGRFANTTPYLDIAIHLAASPMKWQRVSPIHTFTARLDELLATITKKYWLIREPYGAHQWTFLIGSNWNSFPNFRKQGFWRLESPQGANILRTLSWTTKERQQHLQMNLFPGEHA